MVCGVMAVVLWVCQSRRGLFVRCGAHLNMRDGSGAATTLECGCAIVLKKFARTRYTLQRI